MSNNIEESHKLNISDELKLSDIISFFWKNKITIISFGFVFSILSVIYSLSLEDYYKSDAILYVEDSSQTSGAISSLGNLASLAGISINSSGEKKDLLAINTMNSRVLLKKILEFDEVLPSLVASKSFDKKSKKLEINKKFDLENPPIFSEIYKSYKEAFIVSQDKKTGLIYVSVEHLSPYFAKEFLDLIIKQTNQALQERDLKRSTDAINYLKGEYSKVNVIEIRERISNLIEAHLETQMTSRISNDYILKTVDPPHLPDKKSKPSRASICVAGALIGVLLGMIYSLLMFFRNSHEI